MARAEGFEPSIMGPKPIALPLGYALAFKISFGSDLLSHGVAPAVPWALEGLTAVFEMGTGVSPPLLPPEIY